MLSFLSGSNKFDDVKDHRNKATTSIKEAKRDSNCNSLIICKDVSCQTDMSYFLRPSNWMYIWIGSFLKLFFIFYILVCILVMSSTYVQSILVYGHLFRWISTNPSQLHKFALSHARNIDVTTEDGLSLKGWHVLPPGKISANAAGVALDSKEKYFDTELRKAKRIIIFFHGTTGNRAAGSRIPLIKQLSSHLSAHIIAIDYRGYGGSQGWPSEGGTLMDARATLSWISSKLNVNKKNISMTSTSTTASNINDQQHRTHLSSTNNNIHHHHEPHVYVYGQSFGAAVGIQLLADDRSIHNSIHNNNHHQIPAMPITGLILDAPFSSLNKAAQTHPMGAFFRLFHWLGNIM